jgi:hypothetical protein
MSWLHGEDEVQMI